MNKQELIKMLREQLTRHDWWYSMSDDNRYYLAGQQQSEAIKKTIKTLKSFGLPEKEIDIIFNEYAPEEFKITRVNDDEQS